MLKFKQFNERRGISEDLENLYQDVENIIDFNYIDKEFKYLHFKSTINTKRPIEVSNLKIKFNYIKSNKYECNAVTLLNNSTYINKCLDKAEIHFTIYYIDIDQDFTFHIKSVLFHELLHIYQLVQIYNTNKFKPSSWSISNLLPNFRKIMQSEYTLYLLDILYQSLDHELYAQIHQYYYYKKEDRNYDKIYTIIDNLFNFKIKKLNSLENIELDNIKKFILKALKKDKNINYVKNVDDSFWDIEDNEDFLKELKIYFNKKANKIKKKIKIIDNRLNENIETELNKIIENINDLKTYRTYNIDDGSEFKFLSNIMNE